jgi:Bacterial transcriptional activator domain/LysM domain
VRVLRAVLAGGVIAGIVGGAPVLLWVLAREVLPSGWPTLADAVAALTRPDDGSLFVGVLLVLGVLAWAQLTISLLAELAAAVRRRPGVRVELPGMRWSRVVAAALVAGLLGTGASSVAVAAAAPAIAAIAHPHPAQKPAGAAEYAVQPRDTLWRIAETVLGDPLRWRELFALNVGRLQPDGGRLTEATLLRAGWTLVLPDDAPHGVTVRPGDTLSKIADDRLHDVRRTPELFALNQGRPQVDGDALRDPDVIRPGWRITLPATGPQPSPAVPDPRPPSPRHPAPPSASPPPATASPTPQPTAAPPTSPPAPAEPSTSPGDSGRSAAPTAEGRSPGSADRTTTPSPAPTSVPAPPAPAPSPSAQPAETVSPWPAVTGAGGLVVAGLLSALAVRRRRQLRHRPARHRVAVPDDGVGRLEWAARTSPPTLDTRTLDAALRAITPGDEAQDVPDLRAVDLASDRAVLSLTESVDLPPPFVREPGPGRWSLAAGSIDEVDAGCAPFPALASIASRGEAVLLVDLEGLGVSLVTGDPTACRALLRHVAADLANAPWSEHVEILLVGLPDGLTALNPDRVRAVPDLATALGEVTAHIRRIEALLDEHGIISVVGGRLSGIAADAWPPLVLLVADTSGSTEDDRAALDVLAAHLADVGRRGVAVLVQGAAGAGVGEEIHVDDDGALTSRCVDTPGWHAAGLPEDLASGYVDLLAATDAPDVAAGAADATEPWAEDMREDGGLADPPTEPAPEDPVEPVDPQARRRLEIVERQDPQLDDDLARWHATDDPDRPLIAILGRPEVRSPGLTPPSRRSWFTEVLVYLCLHPAGVDVHKALVDLWPDGANLDVSTIRHAFYGARRWAGRGLNGNPDTAFVSDMLADNTYRLRGHLLDWDLFRRLRKRAQARRAADDPQAVADYRAALELIRGPVFSALRPGGYAWLNNHDQRHDLQIPGYLVDAAHELVDIALAEGDTDTARWAAETARSIDVDAVFDRPLTDLMRVAAAEDQTSELERYAAILLDARGFEVPEELPPETFAVLNALLPAGPRRRPPP